MSRQALVYSLGASALLALPISGGPAIAGAPDCDDCFAVVRADGSLARFERATGAERVSEGRYRVFFNGPVLECAYNATIGEPGTDSAPPGELTVRRLQPSTSGSNGIGVSTFNSAGKLRDRPFHLSIECPNS